MAAYACDQEINELLAKTINNVDVTSDDKESLEDCINSGYLNVKSIRILEKYGGVMSVLRGKPLVFPSFVKITSSQDSQDKMARRQYLQSKIDQREYNRMVYGSELSPAEREVQSVSNQLSSVRNQISIGVNMIVAIVATFGICYYVGGQFTTNTSTRMIYGLIGGILVMILEMVLYIMRAARMEFMEQSLNKKANVVPKSRSTSGSSSNSSRLKEQ